MITTRNLRIKMQKANLLEVYGIIKKGIVGLDAT